MLHKASTHMASQHPKVRNRQVLQLEASKGTAVQADAGRKVSRGSHIAGRRLAWKTQRTSATHQAVLGSKSARNAQAANTARLRAWRPFDTRRCHTLRCWMVCQPPGSGLCCGWLWLRSGTGSEGDAAAWHGLLRHLWRCWRLLCCDA